MAWFRSAVKRGADILSGTAIPVSSIGNNGQIYLQYADLSPYELREYLETGSTVGAYIDTGLTNTRDTCAEIKFKYNANPTNNTWFFGSFSSTGMILGYQNGRTEGYLSSSGGSLGDYDTSDHVVEIKGSGIYFDGTLKQTGNWPNVPTGIPVYLFSRGGDNPAINNTRIYYCKIWQDKELVRYLVPAVRISDDEVGMIDVLSGTFYTNSGSQSFVISTDDLDYPTNPIIDSFAKVNGSWQSLFEVSIDDIKGGII